MAVIVFCWGVGGVGGVGLKGGGGTSHLGWRLLGEIKQFSLCCVSLSITASSRSPVFGARQAAHFLSSFCFVFVCGSFCSSLSLSFPLLLLLLVLLPSILPARDTLSLSFRVFLYFITSPPPLLCFSPFRPLDIQLILLADSPDGTHTHTKPPPKHKLNTVSPSLTDRLLQLGHPAELIPLVLCGVLWCSTTTHINLLNDPGPKRINTHFQGAAWSLNVVEDGCLSLPPPLHSPPPLLYFNSPLDEQESAFHFISWATLFKARSCFYCCCHFSGDWHLYVLVIEGIKTASIFIRVSLWGACFYDIRSVSCNRLSSLPNIHPNHSGVTQGAYV